MKTSGWLVNRLEASLCENIGELITKRETLVHGAVCGILTSRHVVSTLVS